jgi:hypothetical protein
MNRVLYILLFFLYVQGANAQYSGGYGSGTDFYWASGLRIDGLFIQINFNGGNGDGADDDTQSTILNTNNQINKIYAGGRADGFHYELFSGILSLDDYSIVFLGGDGDGQDFSYSSQFLNFTDVDVLYTGGFGDGFDYQYHQSLLNVSGNVLFAGGIGDGFDDQYFQSLLNVTSSILYAGGIGDGADMHSQFTKFPLCNCSPADKVFVNLTDPGGNNGSSWQHAFYSLPFAFEHAAVCNKDTIWVAQGSYFPTSGGNRSISFTLPKNVSVYGGFIGNELSLCERDWEVNESILSGDIGIPDDTTDNSFHIVNYSTLSGFSLLDGFYLEKGNADGFENGPINQGGGVFNALPGLNQQITIANSTIRYCVAALSGSGIYQSGNMANISLQDVQILQNSDPSNIQVQNASQAKMTLIGDVHIKE